MKLILLLLNKYFTHTYTTLQMGPRINSRIRARFLNNQRWQDQPKSIYPSKPIHLNNNQAHPIINWVKWILIQLNSININIFLSKNINVYWILTMYTIILNYDSSIISTNQLTLKYPKTT